MGKKLMLIIAIILCCAFILTSCVDDKPDSSENIHSVTVYITETGAKYHRSGCQYLSKSCIPIDLEDAKDRGYTPCSKCNPPR